jgi:Tfp pilus assembly protein FimT
MKKRNLESGASVLEVLIVIAIGAILVAVAVTQFGNSKMHLQRQNIARELKNNLERCRFDSVRRRASETDLPNMSRVVIRSTTSYDVMIDSNWDGVISSSEVRTVDFGNRSDTKILAASTSFPITIRFDRKGHITTDGNGATISPLFTICSGVCELATTITPENGNVISISPTGTIAMLYGGDTIPPLDAPTLSNISTNSNINLMLTVMPSSTATATPTATPTTTPTATPTPEGGDPTPTPTPTPTPESTPTPEPTPEPTPTPTPVTNECALNEKPSQTGCTCSSPRYVRTNGKCQ